MSDTNDTNTKAHNGVDMQLLADVLNTIRPNLQADGGDIELVGVDDAGVVSVELTGACAGCMLSGQTLAFGVEQVLKEHVPGVTAIKAV